MQDFRQELATWEGKRDQKKTNKKTHYAWSGMIKTYADGGARVCSKWLNFSNFEKWYEEKNPDLELFMVKNNNSNIYCEQTVRIATLAEAAIEVSKHRMSIFKLKNTETSETIESNNVRKTARKLGFSAGMIAGLKLGRYSHVGDWVLIK